MLKEETKEWTKELPASLVEQIMEDGRAPKNVAAIYLVDYGMDNRHSVFIDWVAEGKIDVDDPAPVFALSEMVWDYLHRVSEAAKTLKGEKTEVPTTKVEDTTEDDLLDAYLDITPPKILN